MKLLKTVFHFHKMCEINRSFLNCECVISDLSCVHQQSDYDFFLKTQW